MPLLHLLEAASARAVTIIKVEALSEFDGEVCSPVRQIWWHFTGDERTL